ncbi:MAG: hypothetical protein CYPHOPRED_004325, partial [Cyphobasidiales sp. Tagirdzhanova-0007]
IMGGFGLLALQTQLEGGRAKWVQALLGDEWKEQRPYVALPLRLMRVIQDSMYPNGNTTCNPRSPFARLVTDPTSLVSTLRKWTGVASFFPLPPGTLAHRWSMAKWLSKCALPDRWKDYLQSWRDITNTKADVNRHWEERVLDGDLGLLGATNACASADLQPISSSLLSFAVDFSPVLEERKRWWTHLRKLREKLPRDEDTFHLFALGRLISPAKWSKNPPDPRCCTGNKSRPVMDRKGVFST